MTFPFQLSPFTTSEKSGDSRHIVEPSSPIYALEKLGQLEGTNSGVLVFQLPLHCPFAVDASKSAVPLGVLLG